MVWIDQLHESRKHLSTVSDPNTGTHGRGEKLTKNTRWLTNRPKGAAQKPVGEKVGSLPNQVYKVIVGVPQRRPWSIRTAA